MERKQPFFIRLIQDIFFGGKEYRTIWGKKTPFPTATVLTAALFALLFLILTFLLIRISDVSSELADIRREAVALSQREDALRDDLEGKYTVPEKEQAAEEWGFSKENGQKVILPPEKEEK